MSKGILFYFAVMEWALLLSLPRFDPQS